MLPYKGYNTYKFKSLTYHYGNSLGILYNLFHILSMPEPIIPASFPNVASLSFGISPLLKNNLLLENLLFSLFHNISL